jgi:hypothetical protein
MFLKTYLQNKKMFLRKGIVSKKLLILELKAKTNTRTHS